MSAMMVSVYETDEGIMVALCDKCAEQFVYQWHGYAELHEKCGMCHMLNAVDAIHDDKYWADTETWHSAKDRLNRGDFSIPVDSE